jgi:hypothetical protein
VTNASRNHRLVAYERREALERAAHEERARLVGERSCLLPQAAIKLGLDWVVEKVESAIRQWRRDTGHTKVEVEIWGRATGVS